MLILWSGGCDSTLVLYNLLIQEQKVNFYRSTKIRTISVSHPKVRTSAVQKKARDRLEKELMGRGLKFNRNEITVRHDYGASKYFGIIQPLMWLFAAFQYLLEKEDMYAGYIESDCIWRYRDKLTSIFNNSQSMMGKSGKLMLPLEWVAKNEVLTKLEKAKLLKLVWYCEDSIKKPCGKCVPCKTHLTAEWQRSQGWT